MANPSQKKEDLIAEAEVLGIAVEDLPHDEGKDPTNATLADAINSVTGELPVNVNLFLAYEPGLAVPMAGLLAAAPQLREPEAELKPSEWKTELEKYLTSPVPSDPAPATTEGD